jgi:colanic acid/amylovoran biosynthesis glycosyltransferase
MLAHALGGASYSFTAHGPEEFDKPEALGLAPRSRWRLRRRHQLVRPQPAVPLGAGGAVAKVEVVHCGLEAASSSAPDARCARRRCRGSCASAGCASRRASCCWSPQRPGAAGRRVRAGAGGRRRDARRTSRPRSPRAAWRPGAHHRLDQQRPGAPNCWPRARWCCPASPRACPSSSWRRWRSGRPVISTFIAGIPELVRDGTEGWLIPAGDVDALADRRCALPRDREAPAGDGSRGPRARAGAPPGRHRGRAAEALFEAATIGEAA